MIRNGDFYGIAVRRSDTSIFAAKLPWQKLFSSGWSTIPFIRGLPILLESLYNGISALNLSSSILDAGETETLSGQKWLLILSIALAIAMAVLLFVIAPHLLSMGMLALGLGSDIEKLSFHIWDGVFKCLVFILYILAISLVPEIRRLFEYHGAEHKTIRAWEENLGINYLAAHKMSRLHPRCGTTFLLFVICVSILVQAAFVPALLMIWSPHELLAKHAWSIFLKLILIVPVSGIAYELIRFAAGLRPVWLASLIQGPGLFLQRLTTREPDMEQLEVASLALRYALAEQRPIETV